MSSISINTADLFAPKVGKNGPQPFASMNELLAAQRDPRYARDEDYTREVEARAGASVAQESEKQRREDSAASEQLRKAVPFGSPREVVAAVSDPRYNVEPDYTADVQSRLQAAHITPEEAPKPKSPQMCSPVPEGESPKPYRSYNERRKAYTNPLYETDSDYRAEVEARDSVTPTFGES